MSELTELRRWLERRLPELIHETGAPAAAVAVGVRDEIVDAASGLLSTTTGVEATRDSIFQIGSVTKVLTATLVLQLVDEGMVELDVPVRTWLPELRLGDPKATAEVTVRHLLTHTAGFEGDVFTDTGKGDDALAAYVALLADVPQVFEPGRMFSYNNAGYCLLGRLVEVVRKRPYDDCLRAQLTDPLGLTHVAHDPYDAVLHRTAVGHVRSGGSPELQPTRTWAMARSNAPAGSMLAMRARDLVAVARLHLADGVTPDGGRLLSRESAGAMRVPQIDLPDLDWGAAWGLGWELYDYRGARVVGHDGNTIGQSAYLRLVPDRDVSLVVLTNGGDGHRVYDEVARHVLRELAGVELPQPPMPDPTARVPDASRLVGTYRSRVSESVVSQDGEGRLWWEQEPLGELAELDEPASRTELALWRGSSFLARGPEPGPPRVVAFVGDDGTGRAEFLHTGRVDRRVGCAGRRG